MTTCNLIYKNPEDFEGETTGLDHDSNQTLIQVFSGSNDCEELAKIATHIVKLFPNATVIGATTSGEILYGVMYEYHTVVSITTFEDTNIVSLYSDKCDYDAGVKLASQLENNVKVAILFSDGISGKPEDMLCGFSDTNQNIVVSGGAAADNGVFSKTFLIHGSEVVEQGVVGVGLENPHLLVSNGTSLGWNPIGKKMLVTKSNGATVYELDNMPIIEVVEKYFGAGAVKNLPVSIVEFPLVCDFNGTLKARAPIGVDKNNGLIYAGNIKQGEYVRFAIANFNNFEHNFIDLISNFDNATPESIWIYSCMGRKAMLGKTLETEFAFLQKFATTSGFFTYGEFYHSDSDTNMLNLTTTFLGLSEHIRVDLLDTKYNADPSTESIKMLSNLVNSISQELDDSVNFLNDYKQALDKTTIVSKTDLDGKITYANDNFIKISGFSRDELIGHTHAIVKYPDTPIEVYNDIWNCISNEKEWKGIIKNISKTGEEYILDTTIIPIVRSGKILEYIAIRHDVTRLLKQEELIKRQTTDALTGFPNRLKFESDFQPSHKTAVGLINIDRFKDINRFYGYESGDKILIDFIETIKTVIPNDIKLYRNDGDTFVTYASNYDIDVFLNMMQSVVAMIHNHVFIHNELAIDVKLSIGVAYGIDASIAKAEAALHKARHKKIDMALADNSDKIEIDRNFAMLNILKRAIEADRVFPYFQPIKNIHTNKIEKFEALIRISDPQGKVYLPATFLEVAKKTKLYLVLTKKMIDKTFDVLANNSFAVSLNFSIQDIESETIVNHLLSKIESIDYPERVIVEITETESIEDYSVIQSFINRVRKIGAKIAIDDFGSGYSNFAYVVQFNPDYLKVDGSIIKNIIDDENSYEILKAIVNFAHKLGINVVAEFILSKQHYDKAMEAGVEYAQGFYLSEPLSQDEIKNYLECCN